MSDYLVRPLLLADVAAVQRLSAQAFLDLETRTHRTGRPAPALPSQQEAERWRDRIAHLVGTDPAGCWVAESDAGLLGAAVAARRDLTWLLACFVVDPRYQGRGVGRQLLEAAQTHGRSALRGMLAATDDPAAARRYRSAGFTLHPTMLMRGTVPRSALPVVERVREGSAGDVDLMDSVDRQVRHAAHGPDHPLLVRSLRLVVLDRPGGSGYAYVDPGGGPYLLAATNRRTATELMWETLAASSPAVPVTLSHLTAANEWALDVGLACRLPLGTRGYLALRGMRPPTPYVHSAHFL